MLYTLSTILLLATSVFSAPATEKRQDAKVLETFVPNYLMRCLQDEPARAFGSQYTGEVSWTHDKPSEIITFVGFDIPVVPGANLCRLYFETTKTPTGFESIVEGAGTMDYYSVDGPVNPATVSWNKRPGRVEYLGTATANSTGGRATFTGIPLDCQALFGKRVFWELSAARVGYGKNRVKTFQLPSGQGWYLEFAQV